MPTKTKRDEEKWERAKEIAAEAGKAENYAYIMGIYKRMKPDYEFKTASPARVAHRHLTRHLVAAAPELTKGQEKKLLALLAGGKGEPIPDDKIHALAEDFGMSPHDLEAVIYGYASQWAISRK